MKQIIVALAFLAAPAIAYSFTGNAGALYRPAAKASMRMETFGFSFAEDGAAFVPKEILGEAALKKTYVPGLAKAGIVDRPFISEDYPVLTRVAEMNLLTKTAESGILTTLAAKGLTLSQIERLLPVIDDLGLIDAGVANKEFLLNLLLPLLVEPAPLLLGPLGGLLKNPAPLTIGGAALGAWALAPLASSGDANVALLALSALLLGGGTLLTSGIPIPSSVPSAASINANAAASVTGETYVPSGGGQKGLRL